MFYVSFVCLSLVCVTLGHGWSKTEMDGAPRGAATAVVLKEALLL